MRGERNSKCWRGEGDYGEDERGTHWVERRRYSECDLERGMHSWLAEMKKRTKSLEWGNRAIIASTREKQSGGGDEGGLQRDKKVDKSREMEGS